MAVWKQPGTEGELGRKGSWKRCHGASGLGHRLSWNAPPEIRTDIEHSGVRVRAETGKL